VQPFYCLYRRVVLGFLLPIPSRWPIVPRRFNETAYTPGFSLCPPTGRPFDIHQRRLSDLSLSQHPRIATSIFCKGSCLTIHKDVRIITYVSQVTLSILVKEIHLTICGWGIWSIVTEMSDHTFDFHQRDSSNHSPLGNLINSHRDVRWHLRFLSKRLI
jgi:hypothetical protein